MIDTSRLSHKYARALINHNHWYDKDYFWLERLVEAADFLHKNRRRFFHSPRIFYDIVLQNFEIAGADAAIALDLLEQHQRLSLLSEIFLAVADLYREHYGYELCRVSSAQELDHQQKSELQTQLRHLLGKKIYCSYVSDPSLIAGIRVRGQSFVWEDSIAQRLRMLEQIGRAK